MRVEYGLATAGAISECVLTASTLLGFFTPAICGSETGRKSAAEFPLQQKELNTRWRKQEEGEM